VVVVAQAINGEAPPTAAPHKCLPWITILWTAFASVVAWLALGLSSDYLWASHWPEYTSFWHARPVRFLATGILGAVWSGATVGLGAVLADRFGPRSWSRPWRWALGMGVAAWLINPYHAYLYAEGLITEGYVPWAGLAYRTVTVLQSAILGFWIAGAVWPNEDRFRRRMVLRGIEGSLVATVVAIPLTLAIQLTQTPWDLLLDVPGRLWGNASLSLVSAAVSGALGGLALALGFSRAQPRAQTVDVGEVAGRVGSKLRASVQWVFS
jgi:hypothetical protein